MKKLLAILLAALMLLSFVACGEDETESQNKGNTPGQTETGNGENETGNNSSSVANNIPNVDSETLGGQLWDRFYSEITENPNMTAEELAVILA